MKKLGLIFLVAILGFNACGDSKDSKDCRKSKKGKFFATIAFLKFLDSNGVRNAKFSQNLIRICICFLRGGIWQR